MAIFLAYMAKFAHTTVLYLTSPDHVSELEIFYKLNIF